MRSSRRQEFVKTYFSRLSIAAAFCTLVAALLFWGWSSVDVKNAEAKFDDHVSAAYSQLQNRLNSARTVVSSLSGWYHSQLSVNSNQLSVFADEMLEANDYIFAIQFLRQVSREGRSSFNQMMQDDGYASFDIYEYDAQGKRVSAADREVLYPVTFIEPLNPVTAGLLGYDEASNSRVSASIVQSILTGKTVVSEPVNIKSGLRVFYLFKAVFKGKVMPASVSERLSQADGVFAVAVMADRLVPSVLDQINAATTAVSLHHLNFSINAEEGVIFRYLPPDISGEDAGPLPVFSVAMDMNSIGFPFQLRFNRYLTVGDFSPYVPLGIALICVLIIMIIRSSLKRDLHHHIEREVAKDALYREKELAEVTIHSIADGVITTDMHNRVDYMNQVAENLTGLGSDDAHSMALNQVLMAVDEETDEPVANVFGQEFIEGDAEGVCANMTIKSHDGERYAVKCSAAKIFDRDRRPVGSVIVFRDVSKELEMARIMAHQARHDELTGLFNRREFELRLKHSLENARDGERGDVLCYFDLDQFKVVNDTCGHVAGDELLRQITQLMRENIRDSDVLARLGGDEFGVIFNHCCIDKAKEIATHLHNEIRDFRFVWEGKTFDVGASMGLVTISPDVGSAHEVMSAADSACYVAKDKGRNRIFAHTVDDRELLHRRGEMNWVHRVHEALENDRFRLFRQAVQPLAAGSDPLHYEVLIRMRDEQGELVMPMAFIPAAERYNLMPELDRWVVWRSLFLINSDDDCESLYNINISGKSINEELFRTFLIDEIKRSRVDPKRLCFEITETAAIVNLSSATEFIKTLKSIGCSFALDDFGSGLSSFSYLKNLPVDFLKIDGSFVKDMIDDPVDSAMVSCIAEVGRAMNIKTIAEFVESQEIVDELGRIGVDYAQGYHISKPVEWHIA